MGERRDIPEYKTITPMNALYHNDIIRKQPPQEGNNETCAHKNLEST